MSKEKDIKEPTVVNLDDYRAQKITVELATVSLKETEVVLLFPPEPPDAA